MRRLEAEYISVIIKQCRFLEYLVECFQISSFPFRQRQERLSSSKLVNGLRAATVLGLYDVGIPEGRSGSDRDFMVLFYF